MWVPSHWIFSLNSTRVFQRQLLVSCRAEAFTYSRLSFRVILLRLKSDHVTLLKTLQLLLKVMTVSCQVLHKLSLLLLSNFSDFVFLTTSPHTLPSSNWTLLAVSSTPPVLLRALPSTCSTLFPASACLASSATCLFCPFLLSQVSPGHSQLKLQPLPYLLPTSFPALIFLLSTHHHLMYLLTLCIALLPK